MMNQFLVLILGLLSATMAGVIYSRGGETFCNGMSCPANTGCSIVSNYVNEVRITKSSCFNLTGHIVKEQITEVEDGSVFFSDSTLTCTISSSMVNGEMNTSKMCRDKNGELRPMTPEEEAEFEKRRSEAEAAGRKAAETANRMYEVGMRNANESMEEARRLTAAAQEHARRLQQQAVQNVKMVAERMRHMADHRDRKLQRQHENWARRLEEAAARREMAQDERERRLEEAASRREMAQEERERRLEEAASRREMAQEERERRLEEAQARREMKQQLRERKIKGYLPNILDNER